MMNPYEVLGISRNANDETVRKAYLELVRKFPPDASPDEFKSISHAYGLVKDERARLNYYLFNKEVPADSPFQAFVQHVMRFEERKPLSFDNMKEFLKKCAKI